MRVTNRGHGRCVTIRHRVLGGTVLDEEGWTALLVGKKWSLGYVFQVERAALTRLKTSR
jgi:hypothetical protein